MFIAESNLVLSDLEGDEGGNILPWTPTIG